MNVKHYLKDGKEWKGAYHKMADGALHTNKTHTKTSKAYFSLRRNLGKTAKKKRLRVSGVSNGSEEISKVFESLDKAKMAHQKW